MARLSGKTKSAVFLAINLLLCCSLCAEVFKPVQILFPGNIDGNLIIFTEDGKAKGSDAFRLPYVVEKFSKEEDKKTIIFGLGNNSNAFKAFSFLTKGKAERDLEARTNCFASALSPNDLEVFNSTYLSPEIKKRVFTNVEAPEEKSLIFERYSVTHIGSSQYYFLNFITPEYCSNLPLQRWSEIKADDPCRALRKINIHPQKNDYTISVLYGDKESANDLAQELKNLGGIHFIINVPINGELPHFSCVKPESDGSNVFRFSVQPGHLVLPILNIFPNNAGYPSRTTLRMIPLIRYQKNNSKKDFERTWNTYRQRFHKPLKVIPTASRATTSANRISLQAHAEMLKYATASEMAFLKLPKQISLTESVITAGNLITRFPNDRIVKFKATESQLKKMFLEMLQSHSFKSLGFAGCQFSVLGVEYQDFKINHRSFGKTGRYTVATTETTAKEFVVKNLLKECEIIPYNGLTLWQLWIENLKNFKASPEKLFSK